MQFFQIQKIQSEQLSQSLNIRFVGQQQQQTILPTKILNQFQDRNIYKLQMQGGQRVCKFGNNCNKYANGTCTYFHPPYQQGGQGGGQSQMGGMSQQGGGMQGGRGGTGGRGGYNGGSRDNWSQGQPTGNSFMHHQQQNQGGFNSQQGGYQSQGGQGGQGYQQPQQNPRYPNQGPGQVGNKNPMYKNDDATFMALCRDFHFGNPCKFGQTCKKKHYFILNSEDSIRRMDLLRQIPTHSLSKLTKFETGGQDFFGLRMGEEVNFFSYNAETKAFAQIYKWKLPVENAKYLFYDHKGDYVYYSLQNPTTTYMDIGCFQLSTLKNSYIPNAHNGRVTGIVHFNQTVMLSTSMDGELKVWMKEGDNYRIHLESSERLKKSFNPNNVKLELEFVEVTEINATKIIAVGTSDCRLLFFLGNDLNLVPVSFGETYSKVFRVRYTNDKGVPYAVVLTWNQDHTISALLSVNLTNFEVKTLIQTQTTPDNPRLNINIFEFVDEYLLVGTIGGQLSIYRYPDTTQKIGGIWLQNQVNDIVSTIGEIKTTSLKMKIMFILEKKSDQREGSLGIYLIR